MRRERRLGVRWPDARLMTVTARMRQGAVLHPDWPAPLDGLLASASRRRRLGEGYGSVHDPHTEDLPLARWPPREAASGGAWLWLASCAIVPDGAREDVHYWHRRFDHAAAEQAAGSRLPPMVYEAHGRYRAYRTPLAVTVTPVLTWRAIGTPDAVADLLAGVWCTGKKRSQGEGEVLGWEVADDGEPDLQAVLWRPGGLISRPVPARHAAVLGVPAAQEVPGAYRPPYWRPPPGPAEGKFSRQWAPVLAPWTATP